MRIALASLFALAISCGGRAPIVVNDAGVIGGEGEGEGEGEGDVGEGEGVVGEGEGSVVGEGEGEGEGSDAACLSATDIAFPSSGIATFDASTSDVIDESAATSCSLDDVVARWFRFTAPAQDRYDFVTVSDASPTRVVDTSLAFFSDCATETKCVDDTDNDLHASGFVDLNAGDTVLVRVAGFGRSRGTISLELGHTADFARPKNDACSGAFALTLTEGQAATTQNATGTDVSSCGGEDSADIWFTFTADVANDYDFFLTDNQTSANLVAVYDACDENGAATERACGLHDTTAHVDAGETVFVRVGTNPDAADTFNVNVGPHAPVTTPPNDSFTSATSIALDETAQGTTIGATQDALNFGPICGPFVNAAVWYSFTAPVDDDYVFDTSGSSMNDTIVSLWDACDSNGSQPPAFFGCEDSNGGGEWGRIDIGLVAGESVCVAVAGHFLSDAGDFQLNVARLGAPPANDHCAGALPIVHVVNGDNEASESENVASACNVGDRALWYAFTAPSDGDVKFDSKLDVTAQPDLALFHSCADSAAFACTDAPHPSIATRVAAGATVLVRASTNVFIRKPMTLRATFTPAP